VKGKNPTMWRLMLEGEVSFKGPRHHRSVQTYFGKKQGTEMPEHKWGGKLEKIGISRGERFTWGERSFLVSQKKKMKKTGCCKGDEKTLRCYLKGRNGGEKEE